MTRNACKTVGCLPGKMTTCPYLERQGAFMGCTLPEGETCISQNKVFTDEEVTELESIEIPQELLDIHDTINKEANPQIIFSAKAYDAVKKALAIMDKASPQHNSQAVIDGYLQDSTMILSDAMQLTALRGSIAALAAKISVDSRRARMSRRSMKARLYVNVRKSFEDNVRGGTPTEKYVDSIVNIDPAIEEASDLHLEAVEAALVLQALVESITEHVNMIKKRVDNLKEEWRGEGMQ